MVAAVIAAVAGCSPADRYEVLTFFFTGVPPLEGEAAEGAEAEETQTAKAGPSRAERIRLKKIQLVNERNVRLMRAVKWTHGPYAAQECDRCHALSASLKIGARGTAGDKPQKSVGERLLAPPEELCLGCHETKGTRAADERGVRLHGPVASGLCIGCHNPHQSPRRFMLLKKNTVELCTQCHDKVGLQERTAAHRSAPDADCLTCHNPHMGGTAMILKAEFDERGQP